jgi:hypothetical protein
VSEAMVDLTKLSRAQLDVMATAGCEIRECERILHKTGDTVVGEALRDGGVFYEWNHYPEGDVYDPESHAQYYYHAHPPPQRVGNEHGHFHTFLRPRGMPAGTVPLMLPELAIANAPAQPDDPPLAPVAQPNQGGNNDKLSHLIAIAMDQNGAPVRLFTTNRWVTGETWYAAQDVCAMLERFVIDLARPSWPLNRWLSAMFRLFAPQMVGLLHARDAAIMNWRRRHRGKVHVFEDRRLEVTSMMDIDLEEQIGRVALALRQAA